MVIITYTHANTHTLAGRHTHYLNCTEEMQKTKRWKGGVQQEAEKKMRCSKKKNGRSVTNQKKRVKVEKKYWYVNVESESSGGERRYNVLSWPGGRGAECPGASGGRWPDLSGYHYVEGEVYSVFLSIPPPLLPQTPFLSQGKGEVAWGAAEGEG